MGSKDLQYETHINIVIYKKLGPLTLGSRFHGPPEILGKNAAIEILPAGDFSHFLFLLDPNFAEGHKIRTLGSRDLIYFLKRPSWIEGLS
jgi:hypothetical protein